MAPSTAIGEGRGHGMRARSAGFTYVALLFAIAVMGVVLAATSTVWHQASQREKERELLFIGNQFRLAIGNYYLHGPDATKRYPQSLEDLLADPRGLDKKRYLRKIYRDPMTNETRWGVIKSPEGGIMGVYSLSQDKPIKTSNFRLIDKDFEGKIKYREWQFIYSPT